MTEQDRLRWDARYAGRNPADSGVPAAFAGHESVFPAHGTALEVACGEGAASVWLAQRGLDVYGVDVSAVAIERARALAARHGVADRCRFDVVDLDRGLPPGPSANVVLCHRFRDPRLDDAIVARLAPGGLLAVCVLSAVGAEPGRFRAAPGELYEVFGRRLEVLAAGEGGGEAWMLARRLPVDRDVGDVGVVAQ